MVTEKFVRAGMLAVIADIEDFLTANTQRGVVSSQHLQAYLMACRITADGYESPADGES